MFFYLELDKLDRVFRTLFHATLQNWTRLLWEKLALELDHLEKGKCPFMYMCTGLMEVGNR